MKADDFNDAYPQGDEGLRSSDRPRIDELRKDRDTNGRPWWIYIIPLAIFAVMKLNGSSSGDIFQTAVFFWGALMFYDMNSLRKKMIDLHIENEVLKGAIRDNRWMSLYVQDRILERIDEAAPRR